MPKPEVRHWVAGWNMAGHLPDAEVLHGVDLEEGVSYLKDELEYVGDQSPDRDEAEEFDAARKRVSEWDVEDMLARARIHGVEQNWEEAGGLRYWVQTCSKADCKDINNDIE